MNKLLEQYSSYAGLTADSAAARAARDPNLLRHTIDSFPAYQAMGSNAFRSMTTDAAVSGGMVFLESELEKLDPKVREPLTSVTWMRDIPVKSGGGWVDFTSVFSVDYAITGPNQYGIIGGQTTQIPIVQANVSKDIYRVFNWGNVLKVSYIDMQKAQGVGRALEDMLDKGIRLNWNKTLDQFTYLGPNAGNAGLFNNSNITASSVPNGAGGTATWVTKTPAEILKDVNNAMVATWAASQYDLTGMSNQILIPPAQYAWIASQLVSTAGSVSILTYLLENNIGRTQGIELKIFPSRWAIGAGASGHDRMLCYVNDEDRVYLDVTVPCNRVMTMPTVAEGGAYLTLYLAQIGVVKFLYTQPCAYYDGI
jgi:hypothetical protein